MGQEIDVGKFVVRTLVAAVLLLVLFTTISLLVEYQSPYTVRNQYYHATATVISVGLPQKFIAYFATLQPATFSGLFSFDTYALAYAFGEIRPPIAFAWRGFIVDFVVCIGLGGVAAHFAGYQNPRSILARMLKKIVP